MNKPVCLILGAGVGIGGNVAKRFARRDGQHLLSHRAPAPLGLDL